MRYNMANHLNSADKLQKTGIEDSSDSKTVPTESSSLLAVDSKDEELFLEMELQEFDAHGALCNDEDDFNNHVSLKTR